MPESTQLSAIRRANLTKETVNCIIRLIDDLKEREFISTFWAGCSSVREALKILSAIGVVRIGMFRSSASRHACRSTGTAAARRN